MKVYFIAVLILLSSFLNQGQAQEKKLWDWPLYSYNFGGLAKHSIDEQIDLLTKSGYVGLVMNYEEMGKLPSFKSYQEVIEKNNDFKIYGSFHVLKSIDGKFSNSWKNVVDELSKSNTDFWLILGAKGIKPTQIELETKIREVVNYASRKNVKVVLYPHSGAPIAKVEEALVFAKKINHPNLKVAFHTCHELRAGNVDRIEEVLENAKDYLAVVTIAGADNFKNDTNLSELEYSTLKPLYRGNFDNTRVLKKLRSIGYKGAIGVINHRVKEKPSVYLPKAMSTYKGWVEALNEAPFKEYDAPDQAIYHEPTNTWFVSNLGGGISLAKDYYGWISRLDENGKVIDPVWIGLEERMHAPSGMIVDKNYLYACDREGVYKINIKEQKVEKFYPILEGKFINDIALADNGNLYVSDFFGNTIYYLPKGEDKFKVWLKTERLEAPDGLYADGNNLIVASWGRLSEPGTFNTSKLGDVLSINTKTKLISVIAKEAGNLEGVTKVESNYFITDWASGNLLKVNSNTGKVEIHLSGLSHPTDPGYSKKHKKLAFPQHGTNQVLFLDIRK